ncbi:MAG: hypothetical protein COZ05_13985 [Armatimonadetes bacterium CG_4_10_14_3_um_filter_59_10]|nr:MAG: hypothetical protein COZ56_17855 [Armatimonadetes bacterium CG_4_8_14_3_um_filter_58_9]PIY42401.1 MAG: hypothetical protein COZ05_13985 [Armatimonadetes bacterium CG_4_10_14_3_um_filter_59_10]PJB67213.1 MAG: hypothetical protein CO095_12335 [Armatimonadetes bacterium CG_4_9_14_3_um_filter_58_7]
MNHFPTVPFMKLSHEKALGFGDPVIGLNPPVAAVKKVNLTFCQVQVQFQKLLKMLGIVLFRSGNEDLFDSLASSAQLELHPHTRLCVTSDSASPHSAELKPMGGKVHTS